MKKILFILMVMCLFFSCGPVGPDNPVGPSGGGEKPARTFATINLTGAHTLYVASTSNIVGRSTSLYKDGSDEETSETVDSLYSIGDTGVATEVPFVDDKGVPIASSINIKYVLNVNADYILMESEVTNDQGTTFRDVILTRKSDGAVYSMEAVGFPVLDYQTGLPYIRTSNDSLYVYTEPEGYGGSRDMSLKRVKLDGTMEVSIITLESDKDNSEVTFDIDGAGNISYMIWGVNGPFTRFIKASGGYTNLPNEVLFVLFGKMFYSKASMEIMEEGQNWLTSISVDGAGEIVYNEYTVPSTLYWIPKGSPTFMSGGKTFLSAPYGSDCTIYEIDETTKTVTEATAVLNNIFTTVAFWGASNNYFYVSGADNNAQSKMVRVNLSTFVSEYIDVSNYDIVSFNPRDDSIEFAGNDFSTGKMIVAKMDTTTGIVEVLHTSDSAKEVITLERIN